MPDCPAKDVANFQRLHHVPFATALPHEKLQHFGQQVQLLHQEVLVLEHPHVCKALPWTHHWKSDVKMKAFKASR